MTMQEENKRKKFFNTAGLCLPENHGNVRLDLLVKFKKQEFAIEVKIKRNRDTIPDGKKQLCRYLDRLGLKEGYLVIFDPGKKRWSEKLYYKSVGVDDKNIIMVGL